ncbi:DnaJ-domain-containing protein [Imleria badia]|nr:DnaJ-domain-containing protein [Imleria badia]
MVKQSAVSDAYALLGLEQGASMDQVRSAYKQLALRTHPDKNQGNAEATAQFQQLSEAYTVLQTHHTPSEPLSFCPCGRAHDSDDDDYDDDYYFDDEDEDGFYFDEDEDEERLRFFRFLFEEVLRGRTGRGYAQAQDPHRRRPRKAPETHEEYEARLKRMREEREQAEARRAQQTAERKAFEARMREKERKEAEERQRAKAASRKAETETQRKKAAQTAQLQQKRVQTLRSATFAAARAADAAKVKKGVWEDEVDPAGGEVKMGCENYVAIQPEDPLQTLSHIVAQNGDADLVEWLDAHSADPEERNSLGLSAFHVALQHGHVPILKYFFESYDPKHEDHNAIYDLSPPKSLLSIALDSAEPEVVWMILDRSLATTQDIGNVWTEVTSLEGKQTLLKKMGNDNMRYTEIQNLLMSYGGFTPPPTPKVPAQERRPLTNKAQPLNGSRYPRGRGAYRPKTHTPRAAQAHHSLDETPVPTQNGTADPTGRPPENGERGKARGRGRGRGRGYSRGRGRGHAN